MEQESQSTPLELPNPDLRRDEAKIVTVKGLGKLKERAGKYLKKSDIGL